MSSSPRQPYSLRTRKRPDGGEQQDDSGDSPASGSRQEEDDGASDSSASAGQSSDDDEQEDSEDEWSEASERARKGMFGKGRGKRPVKQKQPSPTATRTPLPTVPAPFKRPRSPLPLPYPRRFVPSNEAEQPPQEQPQLGPQAEPAPQQHQAVKPTQSFSNVPLKRPAPPSPVSGASYNALSAPTPPPPHGRRPAKRVPPRPFPSLFVSPPTPALWYLHSRIGEVLNAARLEGTRDESLQMASHHAVEAALMALPTREQQVAMGLIMNRYSTFLTHPSISIPIYPITAPKVAIFLSRLLPTPIGTQLLSLFPQPSSNPLPLANGIDRDLFPLGPGEGERVSGELVKCWVDALGFAQGISAVVWRGLISVESQKPVGGDLAVEEICRGVESVRTMLPVARELTGEMEGRGAGMQPEKKRAKWTKGGKEVEAPPVKTSSPPHLNVSREISDARDLSLPAHSTEMFGEAAQGSQPAFEEGVLSALPVNGTPIPTFSRAPKGPFSLLRASTHHQSTNGTATTHDAAMEPAEGGVDSAQLLADSPTAISPTVSLSTAPAMTNNSSIPALAPTTTPRRSTRGRSNSIAADPSASSASLRASRRGSTSLATQATPLSDSSTNGAEKELNVSARTRSRSTSIGVGAAGAVVEKGPTKEGQVGVRRSPRKSGVEGGGGPGEEQSEKEAQAPSSERETEVESEVEAVRARKEGKAGQKRERSDEGSGSDAAREKRQEKQGEQQVSDEPANAEQQPLAPAPPATIATVSSDQPPSVSTIADSSNTPPPLSDAEIEAALLAVNALAPRPPPAPLSGIPPIRPLVQRQPVQSEQQYQRSLAASLEMLPPPTSNVNRGHRNPAPLEIPRGFPGFGNGATSPSTWNRHPHTQPQHHPRPGFVDPYAGFVPPPRPPSHSMQAAYAAAEHSYHSQAVQPHSHEYSQAQSWDGFPAPSPTQQQQGYYGRPSPTYPSTSFGRFSQPPSSYLQHQPYSPHQPHPHSQQQQYPPRSQYSPTASGSPGWPISSIPPPLSLSTFPTQGGTPYWSGGPAQQQQQQQQQQGASSSAYGTGAGGVPMMRGNGGAAGMAGISIMGGGAGGGGGEMGPGGEFGAGAGNSGGGGGTSADPSRAATPQQPGMTSGWHALE